jgi:hypothetical protein
MDLDFPSLHQHAVKKYRKFADDPPEGIVTVRDCPTQ